MKVFLLEALKNEEFVIFLQPLVEAQTGRIVAAEVLTRWDSPRNGLLLPDDFLPQMDGVGLISELDFYMLERACLLLREWDEQGAPTVPLFVNQSRVHLRQAGYVERVAQLLEQNGVHPSRITLELTEGDTGVDREQIKTVFSHLRKIGVKLAIDDYGIGYSSLSLIKDCDVDVIKLDKSFLEEIEERRNWIILLRTVEMVRELGIQLVCEGVETAEQLGLLVRLGCPLIQGFFFAPPLPIGSFEQMLRKNQCVGVELAL